MLIKLNGEEREFEEPLTIEALLSLLDIETSGTAVEVNREVVPRSRLGETLLNEGDSVEIIRMTGGG